MSTLQQEQEIRSSVLAFFQLKQQYKEKNIAKRIEYPEVYLSAYSLITISVL